MAEKIAIVYNEPVPGKYHSCGEGMAIDGVLDAVKAVSRALGTLKYEFQTLPLKLPLSLIKTDLQKLHVDIVVNLFEGVDGLPKSEAAVAEVLEEIGVHFTGSPSKALLLCEDKAATKQILRSNDIPTPDWQVLTPRCMADFKLNFPCIVKPLQEHASHGLSEKSVVKDIDTLQHQIEFICHTYEQPALVEEFLPGREFRALVVGNHHLNVLPIEEVIYKLPPDKPKIITYSAKWVQKDKYFRAIHEQCPADIDAELKEKIESTAKRSFTALSCRHYASVDIRQDKDGALKVIDVNPNTDISAGGSLRYPLETAGIDYTAFIQNLLKLAREEA